MSEVAEKPRSQQDTLWDRAPGWRNLTVAASVFTLAAVVLPLVLPQSQAPAAAVVAARQSAPAQAKVAAPPTAPQKSVSPVALTMRGPVRHAAGGSGAGLGASAAAPAPALPLQTRPAPATPAEAQPPAQLALAPQTAPAEHPAAACGIGLPSEATPMGVGVVVGFENAAAAHQRMLNNQQAMGGPISPAFADTPRTIVRMDSNDSGGQIVVLPPGMAVNIGDRIAFNAIHRDATLPCAYVPPLATADLGPAKPQGAP